MRGVVGCAAVVIGLAAVFVDALAFLDSTLLVQPATAGVAASVTYQFQLDGDLHVGDQLLLVLPNFVFAGESLSQTLTLTLARTVALPAG